MINMNNDENTEYSEYQYSSKSGKLTDKVDCIEQGL